MRKKTIKRYQFSVVCYNVCFCVWWLRVILFFFLHSTQFFLQTLRSNMRWCIWQDRKKKVGEKACKISNAYCSYGNTMKWMLVASFYLCTLTPKLVLRLKDCQRDNTSAEQFKPKHSDATICLLCLIALFSPLLSKLLSFISNYIC